MIAKGTTHNNGARLAAYLIKSKEGERAQLFELRGFAEDDIVDAFRSVHVMAEATRCEKPFYHCQVRTPDGEELTPEQWQEVADRLEAKLGLDDQPRAIAFHDKDGHRHMHIAWSRIDADTLTAKELKFDHLKLKEACREIERDLGLTVVRNDRDPQQLAAPTREEYEEARRLGTDIHEIRHVIRDCWERSDNGRSFAAALDEQGLILAHGDRRDYVVIDDEGGIHALGKRVLGVSAAETRERLADIDRDSLPKVTKAREGIEQGHEQGGQITVDDRAEVPAPAPDMAAVIAPSVEAESAYPDLSDAPTEEAPVAAAHDTHDHASHESPFGRASFSPTMSPELGRAASGLAEGAVQLTETTLETGFAALADLFTLGAGSPSPPPRSASSSPREPSMATQPALKAPEPEPGNRIVTSNPASFVINSADAMANAPKNPNEAAPDLAEQIMLKWRKDRERDRDR